jgi:hypothetical protein
MILTAMYTPPVEFSQMQSFDFFSNRPRTEMDDWVSTLQSIGLNPEANFQHRFFIDCYMQYLTAPDFCKNGIYEPFPFSLDQPAGPSHPPRASILKKKPKRMAKLFFSATEGPRVSDVKNRDMKVNSSGLSSPQLPEAAAALLDSIADTDIFLSPTTNLTQQILIYIYKMI